VRVSATIFMPVVASYCADFLKADMQHIFRQLSDLGRWEARVITHRRENEALFPWPAKRVRVLPKSVWRWPRRVWHRSLRRAPVVPPTLGEVKEFLYQVRRFEADLLHIYFGHQAVRWLPVLQTCPVPVVVSFHGADVGVGVDPASLRAVFRHASLVLARSDALLADLEAHGCPRAKLRLQRTGVPLDFWSPPVAPRRLPPPDGAWQCVQVCRFVEKKGLATTLRAFAEILRVFPRARLVLIGSGPLQESLAKLAAELGVAESVRFTGFLPPAEVLKVLHASHVFIHPSETPPDGNREGVPNSLLEAMATALPVLATRHGGIPEAVADGVSGRLTDERDARALAAAALELFADPGRLQSMGDAARAAVTAGFERRTQTAVLESCYDEALARSSQSKT
jgi:colanic acid/amylovoran biosynthesis glycosyltransferase